ncbi:hypothetical protein DPMN_190582 [Dreissena polymorpha]|uniref:Uncharacterized protein n=1 Tax=Dreissena polymorpha TaxID=45954 RepID=A0A9D4DVR8_DREPO|nr:hypothetical protein DPMN_190582 [Dreissena polymorpha]
MSHLLTIKTQWLSSPHGVKFTDKRHTLTFSHVAVMDLLLSKCVILKNLSVTASEEDVRKSLKLQNLSDAFHDIERYAVNDTDVRWIILFNTAEDAMKC